MSRGWHAPTGVSDSGAFSPSGARSLRAGVGGPRPLPWGPRRLLGLRPPSIRHPCPVHAPSALHAAASPPAPLLGHLPLDLGPPGHPRTLFPHLNPKFNSLSPNKATSTGPGVRTQKRAGQGSGHLEERALWGCCAADGVPCSLPGSGAHTAAAPAARCWGPRSRT